MSSQPFMGPRYPAGPRPGVRMPQIGSDFNGVRMKCVHISLISFALCTESLFFIMILKIIPIYIHND